MTGNQKIRTLISDIPFGFEETKGKRKVIFKGWEIEGHIRVWKDVLTCS